MSRSLINKVLPRRILEENGTGASLYSKDFPMLGPVLGFWSWIPEGLLALHVKELAHFTELLVTRIQQALRALQAKLRQLPLDHVSRKPCSRFMV